MRDIAGDYGIGFFIFSFSTIDQMFEIKSIFSLLFQQFKKLNISLLLFTGFHIGRQERSRKRCRVLLNYIQCSCCCVFHYILSTSKILNRDDKIFFWGQIYWFWIKVLNKGKYFRISITFPTKMTFFYRTTCLPNLERSWREESGKWGLKLCWDRMSDGLMMLKIILVLYPQDLLLMLLWWRG